MNTSGTNETGSLPPHVVADLEQAARRAACGVRDPEAMRQACERMDRLREENRKKFGVQDIGVQIIREMRDAE
jgi:hypothetical protein